MGPVFRQTNNLQDSSYHLCAIRFDPRTYDLDNIVRVRARTLWIDAELNDSGHNGDPCASDTVWWHWEAIDFLGARYFSSVYLEVMDVDSNRYETHSGEVWWPNIRDIPGDLNPSEEEIIGEDTVRFTWEPVELVDYYGFYLWDRQPDITNFNDGLCYFQEEVIDTELSVPLRQIGQSGTYYWMVTALNDIAWEGGSVELAVFEYQPQGVFEPKYKKNGKNNFYIYPNPASAGSSVHLYFSSIPHFYTIYDIYGRIVGHYPNDPDHKSNITSVIPKTMNLSRGIYFVRITFDKSLNAKSAHVLKLLVQ